MCLTNYTEAVSNICWALNDFGNVSMLAIISVPLLANVLLMLRSEFGLCVINWCLYYRYLGNSQSRSVCGTETFVYCSLFIFV